MSRASLSDEMDAVFRALAHPDRRRMLDMLKHRPGMNVNELTDEFDFTRYAVMKHLKVLEEANLVVSRREGTARLLYLNAIPIQMIYDRWISEFSSLWAPALTGLKYNLENEEDETNKREEEQ